LAEKSANDINLQKSYHNIHQLRHDVQDYDVVAKVATEAGYARAQDANRPVAGSLSIPTTLVINKLVNIEHKIFHV